VDRKTRSKTVREAPEMAAFLRRTFRAMTRRAGEGDDNVLAELLALRADLDEAIDGAARGLHEFGYSWTYLGEAAGMTRQAARQRWGATS
jgi:hypothetical protein